MSRFAIVCPSCHQAAGGLRERFQLLLWSPRRCAICKSSWRLGAEWVTAAADTLVAMLAFPSMLAIGWKLTLVWVILFGGSVSLIVALSTQPVRR